MIDGHRYWIDLLNLQETWNTDDALLGVIPEDAREFDTSPEWPRSKALAYLANNAGALRLNFHRLEGGDGVDVDFLNPVLGQTRLRFLEWKGQGELVSRQRERRARGEQLLHLHPALGGKRWNRGSAHVRFVIHRAVFHFARYAEYRLADPSYPGALRGLWRVLPCSADHCGRLLASPAGLAVFCSSACAESTGKLE